MPAQELETVASALREDTFVPGQALVREGDPGDSYYTIAEGSVEVLRAADRAAFRSAVTGHPPTLESAQAVVGAHEERDARRKP